MNDDVEDIYPLSPVQEGMLFHTMAAPGQGLYTEVTTFRVAGRLDVAALTAAWQAAIARHPALRTAFVHQRISSPHQVVLTAAELPVRVRDLTAEAGPARDTAVAAELDACRGRPFDLTRPPLMRLLVLRLPGEDLVVWSYHHMVLDGWSAALVLAEVTADATGAGHDRPAPPPFREYVTWLRRQDPERDRAFWSAYLAGYREPALLTFPGVRPGALPSGTFRTVAASLPAPVHTALRELAAAHSTTLGSLVEAAWGGTVARCSGRQDVVVGVTVSGRPPGLPGAERIVGTLINTVPVRVRTDPEQTAHDWLARYAAARHPVLDHQHTALTDIHRWAGTDPMVPLFDTVVVFENYPDPTRAAPAPGSPRISDVRYETRTNYAVTLVVRPGEELRLQAVVDAARFTAEEAEALLDQVTTVLTRLTRRPDAPLRDVLAVPEATRTRLLREWNGTAVDRTPPRALLPELIDTAVAERPDHPAVVAGPVVLSYRRLDRLATDLARRLAASGVRPGDRVGVCLGRSAHLVTALLGVARAGAAFVPLDPAHPVGRTSRVLADAEPALVLTDATGAPALQAWQGPLLDVSVLDVSVLDAPLLDGAAASASVADRAALPGATPDGLAYVIFTSGSTGRPKGVAVGHRALANLVDSLALRFPGLGPDDRFLALTTLTFDTSLAELLAPLAVGATVHVGGQSLGLSGAEVDRYVTRHGITALQATPSRYRALLGTGWQGAGRPRLYSCGEAFPPDLAAPLAERGAAVWNMYGPTETTVYSSVERIHAGTRRVSVGRPVSNTVMHVLGPDGGLLPVGCVGELCIGGDGVAEGYWRQPELSAERFVTDPFAGPPARMYRTGDRARHLPDGRIEVLGRMDRQLKLHGYRIEPGEIEAALLDLAEVRAAAVAERAGRLVAWVVPDASAGQAGPDPLRAALRRVLPAYMVPEAVVTLDALPLNPAGKTDLAALPDPADPTDLPPSDRPPAAPEPADAGEFAPEAALAKIFQDVLGVPEAGPDADFFALGGDSLRAMRLASRIQAEFGVELDFDMLFEQPTVRTLAAGLTAARRTPEGQDPAEDSPTPPTPDGDT
ncbi:hypothetical protein GCM10027168_09660 [Streptomyces capparidis]